MSATTATATPIRRNRKVLAPLATLLAAGALVVGSGASFTSSSVNEGNAFETGTLTQENSRANEAIFNANNLKPGDSVRSSVTITNSGSLPAVFTLSEDAVNGFTDPSLLNLAISQGGTEVYTGTLGELNPVVLGQFAAGEARTYDFVVALAQEAGNDEQARSATATYTWDSIQTEGAETVQP